jgi:hypothetical protein
MLLPKLIGALLALQDTKNDPRQGVYSNFPTGGNETRPGIGCEAYIGSSQELKVRTYFHHKSHTRTSQRYTPASLPKNLRGSLHYKDICRDNVKSNFQVIAAFDSLVSRPYVLLLESIVMILFGTYNDNSYCYQFATKASYCLVADIRSSLGL